jgi:hypothetical protein
LAVTEPDDTMARIGEGIGLSHAGDHEAAREVFVEVWDLIGGENGPPYHRCAIAHSMADVQADVREELRWDLRALAAAGEITSAVTDAPDSVASFYPSLHLNIAECYRKLGDVARAHEHLQRGRSAMWALPDDGYGRMIRGGLERLAERLNPA